QWRELARRVGQELPPFARVDIPGCAIAACVVGLALVYVIGVPLVQFIDAFAIDRGFAHTGWFMLLGFCTVAPRFIIAMVLVLAGVQVASRRWSRCTFDGRYTTVGEVARFLAEAQNDAGVEVQWREENVFLAVRRLVAGIRGCRPMEVTWATEL